LSFPSPEIAQAPPSLQAKAQLLNTHITAQLKHMETVLHAVPPSPISTLTTLVFSFPNSAWIIRDKIPKAA